ncbi:ABC transporter substrate-binding protein [Streptomyces buecherae]|uniref:ABC transporter substrate-binding protein n=1 Tax=Streptomyces buecherae TaxID=2763006 RepID=UPI0037B1134B
MTHLPYRRALGVVSLALVTTVGLTACSAESDDSSDGKKRTVKTAMGDVKVPESPKRVVVLDTAELDSAITLGVKPVGATRADVASGFLNYLPKEKVEGIKDVGTIAAPNLETIASLDPDLILTNKDRDATRYKELSAIAPTVMTETTGYPWKENFLVHAAALGKTAEAKKVTADYTAHAGRVTDAIGGPDKAKQTEVNVVRFIEGADIRIYGKKNYIATILADAGLGRPAITDKAKDGFSYDVSPEQIDTADADVIFTSTYGDPKKAGETKATASGLWKNMGAVKNGKVHTVDDQLWIQGIGYTAAHKILDEMQGHLTKK